MTISIVTVNLNHAMGLSKTMASVFKQTYPGIDYIVIDGGSTDHSISLIKENADRLYYWVSEEDRGVYHAQNKGLEVARSSHILFLNSGDYFCDEHSIAKLAAKANSGKEIVYGDLMVEDEKGGHWIKRYPENLPFDYFNYDTLPHQAALIPVKLLRRYGGYDESLEICADWKFFRQVLLNRKRKFLHEPSPISVFESGGISSLSYNQEKIAAEKARVKAAMPLPKSLRFRLGAIKKKILG